MRTLFSFQLYLHSAGVVRRSAQESVFLNIFSWKLTVTSIAMRSSFFLVMLLIAITCFHAIVGKHKTELVREDIHESSLFNSYRTMYFLRFILTLILENKEFTFTRTINIDIKV